MFFFFFPLALMCGKKNAALSRAPLPPTAQRKEKGKRYPCSAVREPSFSFFIGHSLLFYVLRIVGTIFPAQVGKTPPLASSPVLSFHLKKDSLIFFAARWINVVLFSLFPIGPLPLCKIHQSDYRSSFFFFFSARRQPQNSFSLSFLPGHPFEKLAFLFSCCIRGYFIPLYFFSHSIRCAGGPFFVFETEQRRPLLPLSKSVFVFFFSSPAATSKELRTPSSPSFFFENKQRFLSFLVCFLPPWLARTDPKRFFFSFFLDLNSIWKSKFAFLLSPSLSGPSPL